jgi:Ca2+/H+ antiporter, TMEM165/GDT1 family
VERRSHRDRESLSRDEAACFAPTRKVAVDFAIVVTVFLIIFLGELPDKTMFASLVMSSRGRPFAVWLGAAGAFVVHAVIAVTVGVTLFHLLPHHVLDGIVSLMFLVGAGLALGEAARERKEKSIVEREAVSGRRVVTTAFIVIFLAEWGDITQILTANLAAHYHSPLSVGVGALLALWAVAVLAVIGGRGLLRVTNIATLRITTAIVLVALAGIAGWQALG